MRLVDCARLVGRRLGCGSLHIRCAVAVRRQVNCLEHSGTVPVRVRVNCLNADGRGHDMIATLDAESRGQTPMILVVNSKDWDLPRRVAAIMYTNVVCVRPRLETGTTAIMGSPRPSASIAVHSSADCAAVVIRN
jgi:hypothetical protein